MIWRASDLRSHVDWDENKTQQLEQQDCLLKELTHIQFASIIMYMNASE